MKKTVLLFSLLAAWMQVTYSVNMSCHKCAEKIRDNVGFEKGVKDLECNVGDKTVTVIFDGERTDTLKIGNAIRKLGYSASVKEITTHKPLQKRASLPTKRP